MTLPEQYIVQNFFEFGYNPHHNRYNNTYQCSCPICLEGKSLNTKKRCYYIPDNDNIFCHNCGWSSKPVNWIRKVSGKSIIDIINEVKIYNSTSFELPLTEKHTVSDSIQSLPSDCINLFDSQQLEFWKDNKIVQSCVEYIKSRKLDIVLNRPSALYVSLTDKTHKNRLVIPFIDEQDNIIFYQTRTVLKSDEKISPKYKSKTGADRSIFNLNNVSTDSEYVYFFEGPIDACCMKNGVAIAGITESGDHILTDLQRDQKDRCLRFYNTVWCFDSQWRDRSAYINSKKLLQRGERVFIWPQSIGLRYKDFNEIICSRDRLEITEKFVLSNSYSGIVGELKLSEVDKFKALSTL